MDTLNKLKQQLSELKELKSEFIKATDEHIKETSRKILELESGLKEGNIVTNGVDKGVLVFSGSAHNWNWYRIKKDGTLRKNSEYCVHHSKLTIISEDVWNLCRHKLNNEKYFGL